MILYDKTVVSGHQDYGILIPISASRADTIVDYLKTNEVLAKAQVFDIAAGAEALDLNPDELITRVDLERTHHKQFIADLYGAGLEKHLLSTWELIGKDGKPNRYNPEIATKPLSGLFNVVLKQVTGTYLACKLALARIRGDDLCYYLGGGMHHARYDMGAGFCLLNDVIIAAQKLLADGDANLIWIIDVDAHKGCGSAELLQFARERGELGNGKEIFNFSIHMAAGWPLDPETLATATPGRAPLIPCDVEMPLEAGEEDAYMSKLSFGIADIMGLSHSKNPDLVIVVDGADPYEFDGLPSSALLKLTLEQCMTRDKFIYDCLKIRDIPSAWLLAGGYGDRAWEPPANFLKLLYTK